MQPHDPQAEITLDSALREDPKQVMDQVFQEVIAQFNDCQGMQRFWSRKLTRQHYAALMIQVFHHTRENPQLQALATVHFRGHQRAMVKPFLRHAISEVGHDQLALSDAAAVGADVAAVPQQQPLPATTALLAYPFYQIYNHDAVGYLGYLYFLEAMPTSFGVEYMEVLSAMGIGMDAMHFMQDHTTIDVGHIQAMQSYIDTLITTDAELDAAVYALRVTGELYGGMLTQAFANADDVRGFGLNHQEVAA